MEDNILTKDLKKISVFIKYFFQYLWIFTFFSAVLCIPILNVIFVDEIAYERTVKGKQGHNYKTLFGKRSALHKEEKND